MQLLDLPPEVLQRLLQHLDMRGQLTAAQVCDALRSSSRRALSSVTLRVEHAAQLSSLLAYLGKHSSHITSLDLESAEEILQDLRSLPALPQLRALRLSGMQLQFEPSADHTGANLAGTTGLTRLSLEHCEATDMKRFLDWGRELPGLQEARFSTLADSCGGRNWWQTAPPLSEHLTSLQSDAFFTNDPVTENNAASVLSNLQVLQLNCDLDVNDDVVDVPAAWLQDLPRLTSLVIKGSMETGVLLKMPGPIYAGLAGIDSAARLSTLCALQRLELHGCTRLDVTPLAGLRSLRHLAIQGCQFARPAPVAGAAAAPGDDAPADAAAHAGDDAVPAHLAALSAVTDSSEQLSRLDISDCAGLPPGALQHMFPAGRQLTSLVHLNLARLAACADTADVQRVAACCPNLEQLALADSALHETASLAPLAACTRMRRLALSGFNSTAAALCHMSGLEQLELYMPSSLTGDSLSHLGALSRLTGLSLIGILSQTGRLEDRCKLSGGAIGALAQLRGLRRLRVKRPARISDALVLQLTTLRKLTELDLDDRRGEEEWDCMGDSSSCDDDWMEGGGYVERCPQGHCTPINYKPVHYRTRVRLVSKAGPGRPPDVWRQLLDKVRKGSRSTDVKELAECAWQQVKQQGCSDR